MAWSPSPRLFAGRGALRGLGGRARSLLPASSIRSEKILVIVPVPVTIWAPPRIAP
jgi:hypothetical protein